MLEDLRFQPHTLKDTKSVIRHIYALDSGITVEVDARIFAAEKNSDPSCATVFLPGWPMNSQSKSIERFCESYSRESHSDTYAVTPRTVERGTDRGDTDLLYEEARAIKRFIQQRNLKKITLVGYSMGGTRAINLTTLLQSDPEISLKGLILIAPVGLYEQGKIELARKFTQNAAYTTASIGQSIIKSARKGLGAIGPGLRAGGDIVSGIIDETTRSGLDHWPRFKSEVHDMAQQNPHMRDVRVPVVIVSGMDDSVSDPSRIIPEQGVGPLRQSLGEVAPQNATADTPARDMSLVAREKYLEKLFPESPYIRMLAPKKLGVHALPLLRPESVARSSLYMINRFIRRNNTAQPPELTQNGEKVSYTTPMSESVSSPNVMEVKNVAATTPLPFGDFRPGAQDQPRSIERKINAEDEDLPGNMKWGFGVMDALEKRNDGIRLWGETLWNRTHSTAEHLGLTAAETTANLLETRSNALQKREAYHAGRRERLENSRLNKWPIGRQVMVAQAVYHGWRERVNQKKTSRLDSKIKTVTGIADAARNKKTYFDALVAKKASAIEKKWGSKRDVVQDARDRVDTRARELVDTIRDHEAFINTIEARIAALEQKRGGNRTARAATLKELRKCVNAEQIALDEEQDMHTRALKHQRRLAIGYDMTDAVTKSTEERYRNYKPEASNVPQKSAETASPDSRAEDTASTLLEEAAIGIRDLAESKGNISNVEFGRLWTILFKKSPLPKGFQTIIEMAKKFPRAQPDLTIGVSRTVADLLAGLESLHDVSPEFRLLVKETASKRGISELIYRLETRLAYDDAFTSNTIVSV